MNYPQHHTAGAPVATFEGYVDGEPLVKWINRTNMPPAGTKLFIEETHILHAFGVDRSAALAEATALLPSLMTGALKRDGLSEEFLNGMACGLASYCSAIKTLANPSRAGLDEGERGSNDAPTALTDLRTAFVEWHQDEFGYCYVDEKSFTDGDLQAVAWAAWKEAHARTGARQANGGIT